MNKAYGYNAWQKNFGRHVNKGEKAIRILAPVPYILHYFGVRINIKVLSFLKNIQTRNHTCLCDCLCAVLTAELLLFFLTTGQR